MTVSKHRDLAIEVSATDTVDLGVNSSHDALEWPANVEDKLQCVWVGIAERQQLTLKLTVPTGATGLTAQYCLDESDVWNDMLIDGADGKPMLPIVGASPETECKLQYQLSGQPKTVRFKVRPKSGAPGVNGEPDV